MYQIQALDNEISTEQSFTLQACAEDNPRESYKPKLYGCVDIPIQTLNTNNKCPVFQPYPLVTVPENRNAAVNLLDTQSVLDFDQQAIASVDASVT